MPYAHLTQHYHKPVIEMFLNISLEAHLYLKQPKHYLLKVGSNLLNLLHLQHFVQQLDGDQHVRELIIFDQDVQQRY